MEAKVSVREVAALVKMGVPIEAAIPEGADPVYWQRMVNRLDKDEKKPARYTDKKRVSRPRASRRRLSAAEGLARVIAGATCELMDRVNGQEKHDDYLAG